ncbi:MAG: hypothetical protein ACK4X1_00375 [Terricaulis sp.]
MPSKQEAGLNIEHLLLHVVRAKPSATLEDVRRIAPITRQIGDADLKQRLARVRRKAEQASGGKRS